MKPLVDNGVWSSHSWKHDVFLCWGWWHTWGPLTLINVSVSSTAISVLSSFVSRASAVFTPQGEHGWKHSLTTSCCCGYPYAAPMLYLDVSTCSFFYGWFWDQSPQCFYRVSCECLTFMHCHKNTLRFSLGSFPVSKSHSVKGLIRCANQSCLSLPFSCTDS